MSNDNNSIEMVLGRMWHKARFGIKVDEVVESYNGHEIKVRNVPIKAELGNGARQMWYVNGKRVKFDAIKELVL